MLARTLEVNTSWIIFFLLSLFFKLVVVRFTAQSIIHDWGAAKDRCSNYLLVKSIISVEYRMTADALLCALGCYNGRDDRCSAALDLGF